MSKPAYPLPLKWRGLQRVSSGHEERKAGSIGDNRLGNVHEIFQALELFRVPKIELDLES